MEAAIPFLRWGAAALLSLGFLVIAGFNWGVFWKGFVRRQEAPSWIPLLGGVLGALGLVAAPIPGTTALCWLPLLLDWGCAPGLLHTGLFYARLRAQGPPAYESLSLTARFAIALHCLERYCAARSVDGAPVVEWLDYLWEWPAVQGPDEFRTWEVQDPALRNASLGGELPPGFADALRDAGVAESEFLRILEHTAGIVFDSFYSIADERGSARHLAEVLAVAEAAGVGHPPFEAFASSTFAQRAGWGDPLSPEERDAWRALAW